MAKVVVVGAGWSGCAAAIGAIKAGARVTLLERTDMLLGTGLVGGIMRNNGRFTVSEEMISMGGGDLFHICDLKSRHRNIEFPGHKHVSLYDIAEIHGAVLSHLDKLGIEIILESRIEEVMMDDKTILSVKDQRERVHTGDVFIDTTGTAGPMNNCIKFGNGCAMCVLRCPSFGGRVSVGGLAGAREVVGLKPDGSIGAMSGSCKLLKESLSLEIQNQLNTKGVAIISIPENLSVDNLEIKACQQYALQEFKDNIILLDTSHAKLMSPYFNLENLRKIPGFENARYEDPYTGGMGNSMRYFNMSPRDNYLRVEGVNNLFCAGEKAGLLVGHTEAIATGILAGNNSVRFALKMPLLQLPKELAIGDAIGYVKDMMQTESGMGKKYTFSGSVYFERMLELGLYVTDIDLINKKVELLGLKGIFSQKLTEDITFNKYTAS